MKYEGLNEDFNNVRETQTYAVGKVIDEAQKYIEHLEGKADLLEQMIAYLNQLDESPKNETKKEIIEGFIKFLPYE